MRLKGISVWLPALALLVLASAWQSRRLAAYRRGNLPESYTGTASGAPPALTFVMAGLGGFRGAASEVLWFRASRLQEEGRYLELVQLAGWLTMLDPHASEAWVYNAWNLAYNVSIMMGRPEDRLRWVENGIALLRDDGLRFNPREARLYRELAWLYQNKIGDALDSAHLTYKFRLAETLAPCVNPDGTARQDPESRARLAALRLDPGRMAALEQRFGPLDWRLANSHAVYWASQGLDCAAGNERLLSSRAVYQPLILSVFNGRFTGDLAAKRWQTAPNPAVALPAADFLAAAREAFPSRTMTTVLLRYLAVAARDLHGAGRDDLARQLHQRLLRALPPGSPQPAFEDVMKGLDIPVPAM
jgi:hypothetical protein